MVNWIKLSTFFFERSFPIISSSSTKVDGEKTKKEEKQEEKKNSRRIFSEKLIFHCA